MLHPSLVSASRELPISALALLLASLSWSCGADPAAMPENASQPAGGAPPVGPISGVDTGNLGGAAGSAQAPVNTTPALAPIPGGETVNVEVAGGPEFQQLLSAVQVAGELDAAGLRQAYPAPAHQALSYNPADAQFLDVIQESALGLNEAELGKLGEQGLVISQRQTFPTFLRGYAAIYFEHLPVYVSADAILDTVHRSYDAILMLIEQQSLVPKLTQLLSNMQTELGAAQASEQAKQDVALYLEVAQTLLTGAAPSSEAQTYVDLAVQASGEKTVEFMGAKRWFDFSQFKPRGHYAGDEALERYFRAMMWLGRVDLRILETQPDGSQVFNRGQYEMSVLVHQLMTEQNASLFSEIDQVIRTFVGESDYLTVPELSLLVTDLGGVSAAASATGQAIAELFAEKGYGAQQIASHLMVNDGTVKTLPLNRSFLIFGQRYIVDSHVFSETVYDRISDRLMPSPLDAAFAALKNNDALALSQTELATYDELPGALGKLRSVVDAHESDFWNANFYNLWLNSLRALSDRTVGTGLPEITHTEAWGKRLLNAQLGSWSQLRHDTLLYAKQSYTGVPECEFPDAYVEPYPEFFAALEAYAEQGAKLVVDAPNLQSAIATYYDNLRTISGRLREMAQVQRDGLSFSEEQLAFINNAVRVVQDQAGCVTVDVPDGWYADLFFNRDDSIVMDVTVADVHTQPADIGGALVGRVLHVGTALPRLMVTTIDTCDGPKAYVGMAYSYHETVTENFERLDDEQWQQKVLGEAPPANVPWMSTIIAE